MTVRHTDEEARRLVDEIYKRDIRNLVEGTHHGKVVAIDIASGDYAIGDNAIVAAERLRARRPEADVWSVRVGHRSLYHFGGSSLQRTK